MDKINASVFLNVARTGNFRKTADLLGYTQAGISYIINAMEKETGLVLFLREHDGVKLTPEGEALLPYFRQLETWEHQFTQKVNELKDLETGELRVQIFDSISIHWIPGILKKFHDDYPGIKVELVSEEDSRRAEEMVRNQEVDCGFFLTRVKSQITAFRLVEENMLAIVAPDHPLAPLDKFPIDELGNYPYICMRYGDHTGISDIFRKNGITPNIAFNMDNDYAAMAMVSKGLGFCIFPELLLQDVPYEIKCMEFDKPQKRVISIGTNDIKTCTKACRKFIEYTQEWVREHTDCAGVTK